MSAGDADARQAIEAMVLAATEPVHSTVMAQLLELPVDEIDRICNELADEYEAQGRGFELARVAGGYRYQTAPAAYAYVERFVLEGQHVRLSGPALETLAIVAYRQPVTRPEVDEVRGVDSGGALKVLLERELVRMMGRKDDVGRPVLYGTTGAFLEFFGLKSLRELPTLREFTDLSDESRAVLQETLDEGEKPVEASPAQPAQDSAVDSEPVDSTARGA